MVAGLNPDLAGPRGGSGGWRPEPTRLARLVRDPVGLGGLAGGIIVLVGAVAPWVSGSDPRDQTLTVNAFSGAGDGMMSLLFVVLLILALTSAAVAGSRTRVVQLLPAALGIVGFLYMVVAVRDLPVTIDALQNLGVDPVVQPGIWIELGGSALAGLAGLAATARIVRRNPVHRDQAAVNGIVDRTLVTRVVVRLVGAAVGLGIGVWLALGTYGTSASPFVPAYGLVGLVVGLGGAALLLGFVEPAGPNRTTRGR